MSVQVRRNIYMLKWGFQLNAFFRRIEIYTPRRVIDIRY